MSYPQELLFGKDEAPRAVRLRVAAVLTALDNDTEFQLFSKDEYEEMVFPHSFVAREFNGAAAAKIAQVEQRMIAAIERHRLEPLVLRMTQDERVDARETWLTVAAVERWCNERALEPGRLWEEYLHLEDELFEQVAIRAENARTGLEHPEREEWVRASLPLGAGEQVLEIYRERDDLREQLARALADRANPEKIMSKREKTSLLNIIAVLLELVCTPREGRVSEAAVIREMLENYEDKPGVSERNLAAKFVEAKRSLKKA